MGRTFRVRCPIHGFISLEPEELAVLNLPVFQRLRQIKQLALTDLVYPGAVHNRFAHSIGVCHLAGEVAKSLIKSLSNGDYEVKRLRLAGLVHDLGHPPFSHVGEEALKLFSKQEIINKKQNKKGNLQIHEIITGDIIKETNTINGALSSRLSKEIFDLLFEWRGEPFQKSIISGPLDVDKQDYLLRDSYFCGVKYGVFDNHQLLRELRLIEDKQTAGSHLTRLGVSVEGVHCLEQFVLAKFYISTQVYTHKVRLISDQMLLRAIRLGIEKDEIEQLKHLFCYDGSLDYLKNYIRWNDNNFIIEFAGDSYKGTNCHKLLNAITNRTLFKRIFHTNLRTQEIDAVSRKNLRTVNNWDQTDKRDQVEDFIYQALKNTPHATINEEFDDPCFIIVNCYQTKDLREQSGDTEGEILVDQPDGPRTFNDISQIFQSMKTGLTETYLDVYAPVQYSTDEKAHLLDSVRGPILNSLTTAWSNGGNNE